jgi:hypothetical protein
MNEERRSQGQIKERAFGVKLLRFLGIDTGGVFGVTLSINVNEPSTITIKKYFHKAALDAPQRDFEESIPLINILDPGKIEDFERFMISDTLDGR